MDELTVALISDLHFGPEAGYAGKLRKLTQKAPELTRAFVERMNEVVRPDLVVNLGDDLEDEGVEADRARYRECLGLLGGVRAPLRHVAGNHDVIHLGPADLLEAWAPHHVGVSRPEGRPDALYYSFDLRSYHFVVLHTQERKDLDVRIDDEQLAWLEADLAGTDRPTLVFMHHSAAEQDLRGNRWFEGHPNLCLVRERRRLRALFSASGRVLAVFNGHLHWNHVDFIDGLPFVTLQSLIENVDDDAPGRAAAAHAVVRVSPKRLVVEVEGAERARYQFARPLAGGRA
jgi:3',5'-cyclic AMP phosphodiesterase CpdA